MNPDLEKLVRLHRVDSELKRVEAELAAIPRHRQEIDDRLARDRSHLDAAKAALEGSQKARKQNEASVQDLETKRSKYKGQLMDVKTNKEYTAVLHEIEGVERDIKAREDVILEEMEKAEALAAATSSARRPTSRRSRRTRRRRRRSSTPRGEARRRGASGSRPSATRWPPRCRRTRSRSTRASRSSAARAVAEARDGMCQACHVRMRVQIWVEVRKNEQIFQCESCSRVFFYEPPPPTVVVEP